jgi:hypothetical protein
MWWIVVLVVLIAAGLLGRAYVDLQQQAGDVLVGPSVSALAIPDLAALTRMADVVVVGRVAGDGVTRLVAQPAQTPIPFQPPAGAAPPPTRVIPPQASRATSFSIPTTHFAVQVERVIRGTSPAAQIEVVQPGGIISSPVVPGGPSLTRTVQIEDDALMKRDERYVLFLQRTADGTYVMTGGPQGRLSLDAQGRVHPVHVGALAARAHDGQTLDNFVAEVAAVR